jgi:hypothetical protein
MARYDSSRRRRWRWRWRHLDFGACQVWLEADIHRIDCRSCARVRPEQVPWARPNARHTTDFENVAAWLAQRIDKANIARLLRCSWETVDAILTRVVADHLDDARLDQLSRIGVDEIVYLPVTREQIPQARICLDPFHVIKWTNEVVESVYRAEAPTMPSGPARPNDATGAAPASPSAPAGRTSTTATVKSSACYGVTATGSGAPGNSKSSCAISSAPPIPPTPAPTSSAGLAFAVRACEPLWRRQRFVKRLKCAGCRPGLSAGRTPARLGQQLPVRREHRLTTLDQIDRLIRTVRSRVDRAERVISAG